MLSNQQIVQQSRCWVERLVIGENLCPFAAPVVKQGTLRYRVEPSSDEQQLYRALLAELLQLVETPAEQLATTLLIAPNLFSSFTEFNDAIGVAEQLLIDAGLEGEIQIASFHPLYQFAGTEADEVSNYTNRSPFPMLHLIREAELEKAVAHYPNVNKVPERNIRHLQQLGLERVEALLQRCRNAR